MTEFKHNATAVIAYTVGINGSVCINAVKEKWVNSDCICDVIYTDVIECGCVEVIECMGVDLLKEGSFVANIKVLAKEDESPDYEISDFDLDITERLFSKSIRIIPKGDK